MEVRNVVGRGRGLVAPRDCRAGEIVLRESPLLLYAEAEAAASGLFCSHCTRCISHPPLRCERCSIATFCSSECRHDAESSGHAPWICVLLMELVRLRLHAEAETQGRFLFAAADLAYRNPSGFQQLSALDGDPSSFADEAGVAGIVEGLIRRTGMEPLKFLTLEILLGLLDKDKKNAFGLMAPTREDGQRRVRGYALYPTASMLNHDCLPNACRFEYLDKPGKSNTDIHVRLLHDVSQGSEICISYFPLNWNYSERQKRLQAEYGFVCQCERCRIEESWSDDDHDDEGDAMEEDEEEEEEVEEEYGEVDDERQEEGDKSDFPHAMFFVKYLCPWEGCGGTMAPLPEDSSLVMECNVCGRTRSEQEFLQTLEEGPKS